MFKRIRDALVLFGLGYAAIKAGRGLIEIIPQNEEDE